MTVVFLVYMCLLCYAATHLPERPVSAKQTAETGLSPAELDKLPKTTGQELGPGTECSVCLDEIEAEQPVRVVPGCNHGFHLKCADTWFVKNPEDEKKCEGRNMLHVKEEIKGRFELRGNNAPQVRVGKFLRLAMSSDNASSAVTYTSISSDSNGPSWVSLAYVPDPMELDEHVPVYVPEPEHPEYHVPLDDDIQVEDQPYADDASSTAESPRYIADSDSMEDDSIDYPNEPEDDDEDPDEDDDEDPEEDPSEKHEPEDDDEDPEEDPSEEHEPEDEDTMEDKTAVTPLPPRHRGARISVRPQTPMVASTQTLINAFAAGSPLFPLPPTSPAYDQAPLGHRAVMIRMRDDIPEEDMPPQRIFVLTAPPPGCDVVESSAAAARPPRAQYDFIDTLGAGRGLIRSPGHDAQTISRVADKSEDVGHVRTLQASEHRMMTSIEEVNLRVSYQAQVRRRESEDFYTHLHDAQTDRKDIRLEIDVVRGQRTAYETELHESAEDRAVRQMMRIHVLEARAQIDTVEDTGRSC
ncbi:reverse transcriptase domain-containing protein [Tanacetum coccineum]|uniref:Reverse transcriptase domain-containing protein n=1 Tax=Tanacetum coccineum TaxID=301880 RepID=A0ABQ5FB27_9ASTR